jgi:anti-sigma-K factor RskA
MTQDAMPQDEADLLAAEFVLGVLPLNQRVTTGARAKADPAFAARVDAWEKRLSPLNHGFPEIPAPDLLPALRQPLAPSPRPRHGTPGLALGIGAAVLLATLAVALLLAS